MGKRQSFKVRRTDPDDEDFNTLIQLLDDELGDTYGGAMDFYGQYNQVEAINHVVIIYLNGSVAGCGALKPYDSKTAEIKRMYTIQEKRGQGVGSKTLHELEQWGHELNFKTCMLETGIYQEAAIAMYKNAGYKSIPNYGQY